MVAVGVEVDGQGIVPCSILIRPREETFGFPNSALREGDAPGTQAAYLLRKIGCTVEDVYATKPLVFEGTVYAVVCVGVSQTKGGSFYEMNGDTPALDALGAAVLKHWRARWEGFSRKAPSAS